MGFLKELIKCIRVKSKTILDIHWGDTAAQNWKSYVTYYSSTEVRHKFNADTAISFSIKLNPGEYHLGKYNHLDALFLQRSGRGFVNFYFFYTDKGKKQLAKYWSAMEGVLRYED